jgi:hypothetical protein
VSSKLEICNLALDRLAIASLTDVNSFTGDEIGKLCDRTYEQGRNFLLWLHHWNFSIRRISAVTADVVDKLQFVYTESDNTGRLNINSSTFKPLRVLECDRDYIVEGSEVVFTGSEEIKLKYISDITDSESFDPGFVSLLIVYMAFLMSERLTQSSNKMRMLGEEYLQLTNETRLMNHTASNISVSVVRR